MIDWIMSFLPWWAWAGGGLGLVFIAWRFLGFRGAVAALIAVAGVATYRKGRDDQRAKQKEDALKQHYRDTESRNVTEERNRNLAPDARRDRLQDGWSNE